MASYSVMYSIERTGTLTFTAEDDAHALEVYEALVNGDIYEDDLEDVHDTIEVNDQSFYELRNSHSKQLAD